MLHQDILNLGPLAGVVHHHTADADNHTRIVLNGGLIPDTRRGIDRQAIALGKGVPREGQVRIIAQPWRAAHLHLHDIRISKRQIPEIRQRGRQIEFPADAGTVKGPVPNLLKSLGEGHAPQIVAIVKSESPDGGYPRREGGGEQRRVFIKGVIGHAPDGLREIFRGDRGLSRVNPEHGRLLRIKHEPVHRRQIRAPTEDIIPEVSDARRKGDGRQRRMSIEGIRCNGRHRLGHRKACHIGPDEEHRLVLVVECAQRIRGKTLARFRHLKPHVRGIREGRIHHETPERRRQAHPRQRGAIRKGTLRQRRHLRPRKIDLLQRRTPVESKRADGFQRVGHGHLAQVRHSPADAAGNIGNPIRDFQSFGVPRHITESRRGAQHSVFDRESRHSGIEREGNVRTEAEGPVLDLPQRRRQRHRRQLRTVEKKRIAQRPQPFQRHRLQFRTRDEQAVTDIRVIELIALLKDSRLQVGALREDLCAQRLHRARNRDGLQPRPSEGLVPQFRHRRRDRDLGQACAPPESIPPDLLDRAPLLPADLRQFGASVEDAAHTEKSGFKLRDRCPAQRCRHGYRALHPAGLLDRRIRRAARGVDIVLPRDPINGYLIGKPRRRRTQRPNPKDKPLHDRSPIPVFTPTTRRRDNKKACLPPKFLRGGLPQPCLET